MMRRLYLFMTLGWSIVAFALADPFEEAVQAYGEADFATAIELFSQVIETSESPTAEQYYNLASAYYKNGDIAQAILNFNRAYRLDPSDRDTRFNLELAKSKIVDNMEETPRLFFNKWLDSMSHWFGFNTWKAIGVITFVVFLLGLFLYFRGRSMVARRVGFYGGLVALILAILSNMMIYRSYKFVYDEYEGIITSGVVTVKSSPDQSATDIVVIHSGLQIETIQRLAGYTEVKLPDGTIGWIPDDTYELINNFSK